MVTTVTMSHSEYESDFCAPEIEQLQNYSRKGRHLVQEMRYRQIVGHCADDTIAGSMHGSSRYGVKAKVMPENTGNNFFYVSSTGKPTDGSSIDGRRIQGKQYIDANVKVHKHPNSPSDIYMTLARHDDEFSRYVRYEPPQITYRR